MPEAGSENLCRKGPDSAFDPAHRAPERFSPVFYDDFPRCRMPEGACAPYPAPAPVPYPFGRCAVWCRMRCADPLQYPAPGEFPLICWAFSFRCPMGRIKCRIRAFPAQILRARLRRAFHSPQRDDQKASQGTFTHPRCAAEPLFASGGFLYTMTSISLQRRGTLVEAERYRHR